MAKITNLPKSQKVMSIRGVIVDFAALRAKQRSAKQQLVNTPKTDEIKKRERFIDRKRRKTSRTSIDQMLSEQDKNKEMVKQALLAQVVKAENVKNTDTIANPHTEDVLNVPPLVVTSTDHVEEVVPIIKK